MKKTLSSPNRIVWEYFISLRHLVANAKEASSPELCRQATALAIIMAVTAAEVFLNLWFRVRVEERHTADERKALLKDLSPPFLPLDRKLKEWPTRYLGKPLDLELGPGAVFVVLKTMRNSIVHFTSTHETFAYENVAIRGLADTTKYDALSREQAAWALEATENLVAEIFRLAAIPTERLPHLMHAWTGKIPG
jgi:hypothetical protein